MVNFGPVTFGGLASGIDTNSIVSAIVDARRFPVTALGTRITQARQQKSTLQLANTQLLSLQRTSLALRLESTYLSKKAAVSNPAIARITAGLNATAGKSILTVSQLAQGARAVSGLADRSFDRAAALLAQGNTAGISNIQVSSEQLSGTRAVATDLLTQTLQAGRGAAQVTAGDTITIAGSRKDGTPVNATFTFAGNGTDTLQRLTQTIQSAFGGEVQVTLGSRGELVLTETDITQPGNFALSGLTFNDADFSGSTFTIGLGTTQASGAAVAQELTGTVTFTTGNSAVVADGTTPLNNLDQLTGASLDDGLDSITLNVTQPDGTLVTTNYTYGAGHTLNDLVAAINTAYAGTALATIENGKLVVTDAVAGPSQTRLGLTFNNGGPTGNTLTLPVMFRSVTGAAETRQLATSTAFSVPARGSHRLTFSEGLAGSVTGTVSLQPQDRLGSIPGLTTWNRFTIDRDAGTGGASPVVILGLTEQSSVQDLVAAINGQVPSVTATLVDDGGGGVFLRISSNRGGENLRFTDVAGGILETLLDPTAGIDTDVTTTNATTLAADVTAVSVFTPENGGPEQRTVISQAEGTAITTLIPGITINGVGGNTFSAGVAQIRTVESSELNQAPATKAAILGQAGISASTNTTTPPLDIGRGLINAGFAQTVESSSTNAIDHIDGTFTINGKVIAITSATQTVISVLGLINSSGAGVIARYDEALDRITLENATPGQGSIRLGGPGDTSNFLRIAGLLEAAGGTSIPGADAGTVSLTSPLSGSNLSITPTSGTFTINGVTLTVDSGVDTLQSLITKINNSPAGVTAAYDPVTDRLSLVQKLDESTTATGITVGAVTDSSNILAALRLTNTPTVTTTIGTPRRSAEFTLDGVSYTRNTNTIKDVLPDVTLDLTGVSADPVAIDITVDTEKSLLAIRDFVVSYNETLLLLNPRPLNDDEVEQTRELTERQRQSLTFAEIDEYESRREALLTRDLIYRDQTIRRAVTQSRRAILEPVVSVTSALNRLGALGLNTGSVGTSVLNDQLQKGWLVADTTDPDEILTALQSNATLRESLTDRANDVQQLFGNPQESKVVIASQNNLNFGLTLGSRLSFSVGDALNVATITLDAGYYTSAELVNRITTALGQAGLTDKIGVRLNSAGRLEFSRTETVGKALITIQDLNAGASLQDTIGLSSGSTFGADAQAAAGIARRLENSLKEFTGLNGLINRQITTGGVLDQRLAELGSELSRAEERLADYEARIRQQFVEVERALSRLQRDSQFLTARLGAQQQGTGSGISVAR
ncbi:MAG: hypothetical protein GEEBNDBF_01325 [bacterium]|nr:hypothetical protein [bacterium]